MRILLIQESLWLLEKLGKDLRRMGFAVDRVQEGALASRYARRYRYDVIVLDFAMPHFNGLDFIRRRRDQGDEARMLVLSGPAQVTTRVKALEAGADDFVTKPFAFEELAARIKALIRRRYGARSPSIKAADVEIHTARRKAFCRGADLKLSPSEYGLLEQLLLNRGKYLSKDDLLGRLYDSETFAGINVLEVVVCRLRKKLKEMGVNPIRSARGFGYRIG